MEFDCSFQEGLIVNGSLRLNVLLISLGLIFVVVGATTLATDVLTGAIGGLGGALMVIGGVIAMMKHRSARAKSLGS
ncbi:hypothetical protein [Microbacterium sp. BH-3-3-3]|uniref:hypothetical protein n=1 Tax=Microbacterium sp. BH-3-3-3 TaxID=1906742 RepID=UPI0011AA56FC|nr:hypothetical protein [Microbacterium sp. BH-3-3-3]